MKVIIEKNEKDVGGNDGFNKFTEINLGNRAIL